MNSSKNSSIQEALLAWNFTIDRAMPWENEKDPYKIWLSEVILQQTRVEQGKSYYIKFISHYPSVHDLAQAELDEVLQMWEGLGYYSRARNLHIAAKTIVKTHNGTFPSNYNDVINLKGIGEYTAAAILSFGFNKPYAVLDGNVFRILSRIYLVESPIDTTLGKKEFKALADDLLNIKEPASHNQAMMNFGATICTPRLPNCTDCPIQIHCKSYHELDNVTLLPIKEKKIKRRTRHIYYIVSFNEHKYLFNKRTEQDIWKDLFDFPILLEENKKTTKKAINLALENIGINEHPAITTITQQLTHQYLVYLLVFL